MLNKLKYFLIGSPLPSEMMAEKRLNKVRALAAFSPDALSSVAYANQEIFLGLVIAGAAGLSFQFPIALAITLLLGIVALSYAQTIRGYPSGGGSYIVARENLGTYPGPGSRRRAAPGLHPDRCGQPDRRGGGHCFGFPELWPYRVWIALGLLVCDYALLNLRGLRESGTVMAVPVYLFLFSFSGHAVVWPVSGSRARRPNTSCCCCACLP